MQQKKAPARHDAQAKLDQYLWTNVTIQCKAIIVMCCTDKMQEVLRCSQ